MEHAAHREVVGIAREAEDLVGGVRPGRPLADDPEGRLGASSGRTPSAAAHGRSGGRPRLEQAPRSGRRGVDDLVVARAATEVAADRLANLLAGRRGPRRQDRVERDQHPGNADPTLRRPQLDERGLERMGSLRRPEPPHRGHGAPLGLHCQRQTRIDRPAVEEDGARATIAPLAARLDFGRREALSEHPEQRLVRLHGRPDPRAVQVSSIDRMAQPPSAGPRQRATSARTIAVR